MEGQIFKATYSGVPVYEMPCKGVAVMRRRVDKWLNATQILKVAGFDKPQRTRVLEREVQKGTHEKVQGGYGKYQGTWVPLDRGIELSRQYGVDHLLQPIFAFQPTSDSPPLAPKHITAPIGSSNASKSKSTVASRGPAAPRASVPKDSDSERSFRPQGKLRAPSGHAKPLAKAAEERSLSPNPSQSSSSRTPSPIASDTAAPPPIDRKRKFEEDEAPTHGPSLTSGLVGPSGSHVPGGPASGTAPAAKYARMILDYFVSESTNVPSFLVNPPIDFDPNVVIDDDGHTALHWACAMGRIRIVKLLLSAGADIFRANVQGQTALMRSVMFTNGYDLRKFGELFELLHRSTINLDLHDRTVFHYVADVALLKGKVHAARYYLETILSRLIGYPNDVANMVNYQDAEGETALTLAARARSKRLVKMLLDHGADPKIANNDGKSAEDYILEDERFRAASQGPSGGASGAPNTGANGSSTASLGDLSGNQTVQTVLPAPTLHYSETGRRAASQAIPQITELLESLAQSYDSELASAEQDLSQAQALLININTEIEDSTRFVQDLKAKAEGLEAGQQTLEAGHAELESKMGKRYRFGWEKYVRDEEDREKRYQEAAATAASHREGAAALPQEAQSLLAEDTSDLDALLAPPEDLAAECAAIRGRLAGLREQRKELFATFVGLQSEVGTGPQMAEYRKLIALGCGLGPGELSDEVMKSLEEVVEAFQEEDFAAGREGAVEGGL